MLRALSPVFQFSNSSQVTQMLKVSESEPNTSGSGCTLDHEIELLEMKAEASVPSALLTKQERARELPGGTRDNSEAVST